MKYTYVISDDSVIGLASNYYGAQNIGSYILGDNDILMEPYDISVFGLGPGTATLKIYDGKKLVRHLKFTVEGDKLLSPSSYLPSTGDKVDNFYGIKNGKSLYLSQKYIDNLNKRIMNIAKAATKKDNNHERVMAIKNKVMAYDAKIITEVEVEEKEFYAWMENKKLDKDYDKVFSLIYNRIATPRSFANLLNAALLNIGLDSYIVNEEVSDFKYDWNVVVRDSYNNEHTYDPTTKKGFYLDIYTNSTEQKYYKTSKENSTHLPAWIIEHDTKTQYLSKGDKYKLSDSDMNNNVYSSDTSVAKVSNGKVTAVAPGIAMIYRYNDKYVDVFFVMVKESGKKKTINGKIYTTKHKLHFDESDRAPYLLNDSAGGYGYQGTNYSTERMWEYLRLSKLEDAFGHGSKIVTSYKAGILTIKKLRDGENTTIIRIGDLDYSL